MKLMKLVNNLLMLTLIIVCKMGYAITPTAQVNDGIGNASNKPIVTKNASGQTETTTIIDANGNLKSVTIPTNTTNNASTSANQTSQGMLQKIPQPDKNKIITNEQPSDINQLPKKSNNSIKQDTTAPSNPNPAPPTN